MTVIAIVALLHSMGVGVPVLGTWIFSMSTPSKTSWPDNSPQADQSLGPGCVWGPVVLPPVEQDLGSGGCSGSESSQTSMDPAEALKSTEKWITEQRKALDETANSLEQQAAELRASQAKLSLEQQTHKNNNTRFEVEFNEKVKLFKTQQDQTSQAQAEQTRALNARQTVFDQEKADLAKQKFALEKFLTEHNEAQAQ